MHPLPFYIGYGTMTTESSINTCAPLTNQTLNLLLTLTVLLNSMQW